MKRWVDDIEFPSQRKRRPTIIARTSRGTFTKIDAKEHIKKRIDVKNMHKKSWKDHRFAPLGKIANVPELVKTYRSLRPSPKSKRIHGSQSQNEIDFIDDVKDHAGAVDRVKELCKQKWESRNLSLEQELERSLKRVHYTKARTGLLNAFTNPNSRRSSKFDQISPTSYGSRSPKTEQSPKNSPKLLNPIRNKIELLEPQNLSLAEKLSFHDESPRSEVRRINTLHFPWDEPFIFAPQSEESTPRLLEVVSRGQKEQKKTKKITFVENVETSPEICHRRLYHHVSLLGNEGRSIMMGIVEDQKHNVLPSRGEIKMLKNIVQKRLTKRQMTKQISQELELTETEIADKIRNKSVNSISLIDKFFKYSIIIPS